VTPYNVSVFSITESTKTILGNYEMTKDISETNKNFISGAIAGSLSLVFYNPVEVLKVRA